MEVPDFTPRLVRDLAKEVTDRQGSGIAFQSTAVAALGAVERAQISLREAHSAALSLAQQVRVAEMQATLDAAAHALDNVLDSQGRCLMEPAPKGLRRIALRFSSKGESGKSWWTITDEAVSQLGQDIERLTALMAGQTEQSPARRLCQAVASLLRSQRAQLTAEATRWEA